MEWLSEGANSWQLTAATLVGLMSVPGLVVLYGGVMQKRWSVNSMMMAFIAFAVVSLLERYFPQLVDYAFTATMENELDDIAGGDAAAVELEHGRRAHVLAA